MTRIAPLLLATLLLGGCLEKSDGPVPSPQELSSNSIAAFCGMSLAEHPGPKAQLFLKGQAEPVWFASVRDMFAYTLLPEEPKNIRAVYVNDMGRARNWDRPEPGTWVDARKAVFVIGSRRQGGMQQQEAVPFGTEQQARAYIAGNGGRIVGFTQVPANYVLPGMDPAPPPGG
jgi:copper chaperone NosL